MFQIPILPESSPLEESEEQFEVFCRKGGTWYPFYFPFTCPSSSAHSEMRSCWSRREKAASFLIIYRQVLNVDEKGRSALLLTSLKCVCWTSRLSVGTSLVFKPWLYVLFWRSRWKPGKQRLCPCCARVFHLWRREWEREWRVRRGKSNSLFLWATAASLGICKSLKEEL